MNLAELTPRLQAEHHHDLQACQIVSAAVAEVEHGLSMLARLGHVYHLSPGPPYSLPEWPRTLFHVDAAPNGRVVNSWWEAEELGYGWWPTLQEAQNKEGIRAQFRGRGGVQDRALPMLADSGPAGPRPETPIPQKSNGGLIDEWRKQLESGGPSWRDVVIHPAPVDSEDRGTAPESTAGNGESLSGLPDNGDQGPGGNGASDRVQAPAGAGADRVSEDALQENTMGAGGEPGARASSELQRVLAESIARGKADTRTAVDAFTSDRNH